MTAALILVDMDYLAAQERRGLPEPRARQPLQPRPSAVTVILAGHADTIRQAFENKPAAAPALEGLARQYAKILEGSDEELRWELALGLCVPEAADELLRTLLFHAPQVDDREYERIWLLSNDGRMSREISGALTKHIGRYSQPDRSPRPFIRWTLSDKPLRRVYAAETAPLATTGSATETVPTWFVKTEADAIAAKSRRIDYAGLSLADMARWAEHQPALISQLSVTAPRGRIVTRGVARLLRLFGTAKADHRIGECSHEDGLEITHDGPLLPADPAGEITLNASPLGPGAIRLHHGSQTWSLRTNLPRSLIECAVRDNQPLLRARKPFRLDDDSLMAWAMASGWSGPTDTSVTLHPCRGNDEKGRPYWRAIASPAKDVERTWWWRRRAQGEAGPPGDDRCKVALKLLAPGAPDGELRVEARLRAMSVGQGSELIFVSPEPPARKVEIAYAAFPESIVAATDSAGGPRAVFTHRPLRRGDKVVVRPIQQVSDRRLPPSLRQEIRARWNELRRLPLLVPENIMTPAKAGAP